MDPNKHHEHARWPNTSYGGLDRQRSDRLGAEPTDRINGLGTGGRYSPSTDSWTPTSTTNAPTARFAHTAIWTGTEMIVWGGYNNSNRFNTGGRYDPSTDTWAATNTTNAQRQRRAPKPNGFLELAPNKWMKSSNEMFDVRGLISVRRSAMVYLLDS